MKEQTSFIHNDINHGKQRHSRESGNPGKHWIPPYQVRGRLSQARNDKPHRTYYLGLNLGNILIIACKDQGYFQKGPWDCVLPNKMQSQVGKLSRNRTLPLLWPE